MGCTGNLSRRGGEPCEWLRDLTATQAWVVTHRPGSDRSPPLTLGEWTRRPQPVLDLLEIAHARRAWDSPLPPSELPYEANPSTERRPADLRARWRPPAAGEAPVPLYREAPS